MKRALKFFLILAIIIILPFGAIMLAIPLSIKTKVAKVDENWKPDTAVLFWAKFWSVFLQVSFDFVLAILYNEGASESRMLRQRELEALGFSEEGPNIGYPVGDIGDSRGPALGPGQVLRENVERLWNDTPDSYRFIISAPTPYHLAVKGYERQSLWVAVTMMKEVIKQANGDLQDAAKRYNGGSGMDPRALAYGEKAAATIERIS